MKSRPPSIAQRFWTAVCRYAYHRAIQPGTNRKPPDGLPGHRDPDSPCRAFWPVGKPSGTGSCQTDGHYLCVECEEISQESLEERE